MWQLWSCRQCISFREKQLFVLSKYFNFRMWFFFAYVNCQAVQSIRQKRAGQKCNVDCSPLRDTDKRQWEQCAGFFTHCYFIINNTTCLVEGPFLSCKWNHLIDHLSSLLLKLRESQGKTLSCKKTPTGSLCNITNVYADDRGEYLFWNWKWGK